MSTIIDREQMIYNHEEEVERFLQEKQEENPKQYQDVCQKYPVHTRGRARTVRRREITVGLLGLSPSRVSLGTAMKNGVESEYQDEGG